MPEQEFGNYRSPAGLGSVQLIQQWGNNYASTHFPNHQAHTILNAPVGMKEISDQYLSGFGPFRQEYVDDVFGLCSAGLCQDIQQLLSREMSHAEQGALHTRCGLSFFFHCQCCDERVKGHFSKSAQCVDCALVELRIGMCQHIEQG